jgi:hypothetical protein
MALIALAMGSLGGSALGARSSFDSWPNDYAHASGRKLPLTNEELDILDSLGGKEKKKYIKELKDKYSQQPTGGLNETID